VKGLYQRPPPNFTGRDSLFEDPVEPASLTIDTNLVTVDAAALTMLSATLSRGTVHLSSP
jgi:adenylylsulfate kinase-like enzyme